MTKTVSAPYTLHTPMLDMLLVYIFATHPFAISSWLGYSTPYDFPDITDAEVTMNAFMGADAGETAEKRLSAWYHWYAANVHTPAAIRMTEDDIKAFTRNPVLWMRNLPERLSEDERDDFARFVLIVHETGVKITELS